MQVFARRPCDYEALKCCRPSASGPLPAGAPRGPSILPSPPGEGRRLAAEASSFSPPVALEVSVERLDVTLVLAEGVREIGVASPVARGALGVRVLVLGVARVRARAFEFPLAPTLRHAFLVGCDWRELGRRRVNPPREVPLAFEDFAGQDAHARRGGRQGERGEDASFHGWGAEVVSARVAQPKSRGRAACIETTAKVASSLAQTSLSRRRDS